MNLILATLIASAFARQDVSPPEVGTLPQIELHSLVERLLPGDGDERLSFYDEENLPVTWITPDGGVERVGLARVTVSGRVSTVEQDGQRELAWSIVVRPDLIKIEPGTPQAYCFGAAYTGCSFSIEEAFEGSALGLYPVCADDFGGFSRVTVVEAAAEGSRVFVRHTLSGDAEGANAWLEISLTPLPCEI
jgi:hypothetical protein